MANLTINDLPAAASVAPVDWLAVWKTNGGITRKIAVGDLMGGFVTGGGTIVTNGYTVTVPRTGVLTTAYAVDDYLPVITGSVSNPTVTYTTQVSSYKKIDELVIYDFTIVIATISGGSGDLRISVPFTARGTSLNMWTNTVVQVGLNAVNGECTAYILGALNFMRLRKDAVNYTIAMTGAGDVVQGSITYRATA
jgi:hypothetical protein